MHAMTEDRDTEPRRPDAPEGRAPRRMTSADLFGGAREVVIEHDAEAYRLRWTSKGKLILTK